MSTFLFVQGILPKYTYIFAIINFDNLVYNSIFTNSNSTHPKSNSKLNYQNSHFLIKFILAKLRCLTVEFHA